MIAEEDIKFANSYFDTKFSYDNFASKFKNSTGEYFDCLICCSFLDEQTYVLYKLKETDKFKLLATYCS